MTRRQRLVKIAMRENDNYELNIVLLNMTKTILANKYTAALAAYGNNVMAENYDTNAKNVEVLAIHNNIQ